MTDTDISCVMDSITTMSHNPIVSRDNIRQILVDGDYDKRPIADVVSDINKTVIRVVLDVEEQDTHSLTTNGMWERIRPDDGVAIDRLAAALANWSLRAIGEMCKTQRDISMRGFIVDFLGWIDSPERYLESAGRLGDNILALAQEHLAIYNHNPELYNSYIADKCS